MRIMDVSCLDCVVPVLSSRLHCARLVCYESAGVEIGNLSSIIPFKSYFQQNMKIIFFGYILLEEIVVNIRILITFLSIENYSLS